MNIKFKIIKYFHILHRDLGYFFVLTTIVYAISGIAINHANDWNPDFIVKKNKVSIDLPEQFNSQILKEKLSIVGIDDKILTFDKPSPEKLKIYFKNGSLLLNKTLLWTGEMELVQRRPVLYGFNILHRNPGGLWILFSDIYAICLIFLSISGLFLLRGKLGFWGRGKWIFGLGSGITVVFFLLFVL